MMGSLLENLYDYKCVGIPEKDDTGVLYASSARHFVIIFQAFKNLIQSCSLETKESIFKAFLKNVFEKQQWKKHELPIGYTKEYLSLDELLKETQKLLNNDFSSIAQEEHFDVTVEDSQHENIFKK